MTIQATEELLDAFLQRLSGLAERSQTFMEIAGYPHYENVCSNILRFFMDPEKPHGLETLMLDALLMSAGNDTAANKGVGGNVSVEREVTTVKGNRIDLLIESDDHVILIENKIHASVSNPFDDYCDHLDRVANGRAKHKLLLTLYPTTDGSDWGFRNLTHEEFVGQVRSLLGSYVSRVDTRYLTLFLDFLNTLDNLKEGTRMNQEILQLLSNRSADVERFLAELRIFQDEMRRKVQELGSHIDSGMYQNVSQRYWRPRTDLIDMLIYDVELWNGQQVEVATIVRPRGWTIRLQLFPNDPSKLKALLERLDIRFEEKEYLIYPNQPAYEKGESEIEPVLKNIVDKLATSQEWEGNLGPA